MAEADWDEVRYIGKRQPKSGTLKTQQNTAKLDRETEELHHDHVALDVSKIIQQARQAKGWTQKDLATYKESIILLAKKKYNERMATGGGPVGKITQAEGIVLEFLMDKPQLIGIPGGIESGVIEPEEDAASVADFVLQQAPKVTRKN
ncbi:EDF1-like protein, partial [Mya arenaria]